LKNFAIEKNAWYGHGHTFPCGQKMQSLSASMLQNHLILTRPIELDEDLVEQLRASGKGWQTRLNAQIRQWMSEETKDSGFAH
jgi:hypothetical protein